MCEGQKMNISKWPREGGRARQSWRSPSCWLWETRREWPGGRVRFGGRAVRCPVTCWAGSIQGKIYRSVWEVVLARAGPGGDPRTAAPRLKILVKSCCLEHLSLAQGTSRGSLSHRGPSSGVQYVLVTSDERGGLAELGIPDPPLAGQPHGFLNI